jgi:hypothetical protein
MNNKVGEKIICEKERLLDNTKKSPKIIKSVKDKEIFKFYKQLFLKIREILRFL